ncbi:hypothetical protein WKI65_20410 [Streptomyces sp. MS1.AVA.3]
MRHSKVRISVLAATAAIALLSVPAATTGSSTTGTNARKHTPNNIIASR